MIFHLTYASAMAASRDSTLSRTWITKFFRELKDLNYFRQVALAFGTVRWPHEQDISPETLYLEGVPVSDNGDCNG